MSKESLQVENGLKYLVERQTETGAWKRFPFYHTFHAISRADQASARKQFEKAESSVVRRQNRDGSWGRNARETKTYLVLDAFQNAGKI